MGVDTKKPLIKDTKKIEEKIANPEEPKYSLDDIILPERVKEEILDVVAYEENAHLVFEIWGFKKTHKQAKRIGINLYGEPGTGKTMAAHAIAKELGRKILIVNYADIESKYVGETPKNIRKVFEAAKETKSIIFFDEADAILSKRVTNMTQAVDVSVNQTRSVMLMQMNEYEDYIIFATNFIENYDPAFMRRIAVHIKFELPDYLSRVKLWRKYIPEEVPNNIEVEAIAERYEEVSGSDIANAMLNAAFKAARQNATNLGEKYVEEAIEAIIRSKEANKKVTTREITEEEYKRKSGK